MAKRDQVSGGENNPAEEPAPNAEHNPASAVLHVFCARPGLRRAGIEHPFHAVYAIDAFTEEQAREMTAEPLLVVVLGRTCAAPKEG